MEKEFGLTENTPVIQQYFLQLSKIVLHVLLG